MDTKLKNIKYSYGTKVLAFFLALTLVVSAGVFLASIVDVAIQYSSNNVTSLLTKKEFNYTDSAAFESEIDNQIDNLRLLIHSEDYKSYVKGVYCTKDEELSLAEKYFDERLSRYSQDNYDDEYGGSVTGSSNFYYELEISEETVSFNNTTAKADFISRVSEAYDDEIVSATRNCENEKVVAKNNVESLVNLKYLIKNTKTGEIITNSSVEEIDSCSDGWYVVYTASSGIIKSSDSSEKSTYRYYYLFGTNSVLNNYFGDNNYDITLALPTSDKLVEGDAFYSIAQSSQGIKNNTTSYAVAVAVLLLIAFVLSVYLVMVSDRINGSDEPQLSWVDKIPTDLHFIFTLGMQIGCILAAGSMVNEVFNSIDNGYYEQSLSYIMIIVNALLFGLFWAVTVEWAMHIARYYKVRKPYFRSSLFGIILLAIVKFSKEILNAIKRVINFAPKKIRKKAFYIVFGYISANFVLFSIFASLFSHSGGGVFFTLLLIICINLIILTLIWKYLISLDEIVEASEKGKNGEAPEKIDSEKYPEPMKSLAENLYITQDEMKKAVDEAIKGERVKTELITNVSHDLKTPLTSIITYVDLLKKCDISDTQAQKYISVLDDKSIRLKRLIEDLVEASKVSSGAVVLNKMSVNLNELAVQAIAEVEDTFNDSKLEIVYDIKQGVPIVFADSQKTWRVIDNLLTNARKYSLTGSRVYVEVGIDNNNGYFSIKNVSREALNIDAETLTQRFVRGDASRTHEGSGLGLSIAKDLCALQGGELKLDIDGDLFKATIELPLVTHNKEQIIPSEN